MPVRHPFFARLYPRMARALERAGMAGHRAERLPVDRADAVVCGLVLCSIPDQDAALREIRRVLVPSGQFRFLEHVRADTPGMVRVQRFMDATFWPRIAGGCRTGRDTVTAIERAGFTIERLDRFRVPDLPGPTTGHVLSVATP